MPPDSGHGGGEAAAAAASVSGFADVVLPVPLDQAFTYGVPEGMALQPGVCVQAPWGSRRLAGIVTALRAELPPALHAAQIKPLSALLDPVPVVDAALLELVTWAASYYQAPIGEVMRCALPPAQLRTPPKRQRRAVRPADLKPEWRARPRIEHMHSAQRVALAAIADVSDPRPILLHGVTGSGKTAVYLSAIEQALAAGGSALLLVPEIGLTPALFADFEDAFPDQVAILHSGLTPRERSQHWLRLRDGSARVGIGTRSAVFAPLRNLTLILVDEEHDPSFKQQESPRYHGRDLATVRAKLAGARLVLGSATPSLESYRHARAGKYRLVEMPERVERRPLPTIRVVDMKAEFRSEAKPPARGASRSMQPEAIFSTPLREALADRLERRQQSLILINRRGFAPSVLCRACGALVNCRDCALTLTYHKRDAKLLCHFCGYTVPVPQVCSNCGSEHIYFAGTGSEKVEEKLAQLFPAARIARLDRDTSRDRHHFTEVLGKFRAGELDILVGTQMIAKGHDVPGVTLVGVLQADLGLTFPDFRAAERTFQLLTQVAGRAGRGDEPGEVLLQVMHPEHYAVEAAASGDFAGFYEKEASFRGWMHYPPFASLAVVQLRHRAYERVLQLASQSGEFLAAQARQFASLKILGPSPALLARAKTEYRFQFLIKSGSRRELGILLRGLRGFARAHQFPATALVVDVDPLSV